MGGEERPCEVLYLYGVVQRGQRLPKGGVASLEAIPFSTLSAVVEPVLATEFSSDLLEERLRSIEWVAPLARKHAAVLDEVMRHGPVVPARLCTLFSGVRALTRSLRAQRPRLQRALVRLAGHQEWGIKVTSSEATLRGGCASTDREAEALEAARRAASPGQAYVLGKKRERRLAELVALRIDDVTDGVLDALASVATDIRVLPLPLGGSTGGAEMCVLNAALLVDGAAVSRLDAATGALSSRFGGEGFAFELTGPWPPYSFSEGDDDSDREPIEPRLVERSSW